MPNEIQRELKREIRLPISTQQMVILLVIGVVLWFIAAMLLRMLGPSGIYNGAARIVLYAAIIPGTVPFLLAAIKCVGLAKDQIFVGVGMMVLSATLVDGVVLAWFPQVYGDSAELIAGAGGTILWGVGVALVLGLFMNRSVNKAAN